MGIVRKTMSVSTLGVVDDRTGSERPAAATRKVAKAHHQQARAMDDQAGVSARPSPAAQPPRAGGVRGGTGRVTAHPFLS